MTDVSENTRPSNLVASLLTVAENEAIGTVVGEVNATDPDAGATFELMEICQRSERLQ